MEDNLDDVEEPTAEVGEDTFEMREDQDIDLDAHQVVVDKNFCRPGEEVLEAIEFAHNILHDLDHPVEDIVGEEVPLGQPFAP